MRYLGIDFGSKNVGLAVSDDFSVMAFPFAVLENSEGLLEKIIKVCVDKDISEIVIGESKNFSMDKNKIMKEIELFVKVLENKGFIVHMHPEFLTSAEAERLQGKNNMIDASAAAIILKSYLDSKK